MKNIIFILQLTVLLASCTDKKKVDLSPNIVLIVADDLGYGDISCYGNSSTNTPNLDILANKGIKFTDFHTNGAVCSPTRAALMTGKYQQRTGISGVITAKSHRTVGLHLNEITIAEELKKNGYNTAIFGKWHLGYAEEYNPTLQGFDEFKGFVSGNVDYHGHIDQEGYLDWWNGINIEDEKGYATDLITAYGVKYIDENHPGKTRKPFFLYLPHEAPHYPYQKRIDKILREVGEVGTNKIQKEKIASIYKEMIEVMDEGVGKIIQSLKDNGQYENTIILFISDNGASKFGNNGVLRGTKGSPYEGGSRVPAIFSYPNKIKQAIINNEIILTMDVLPTLLDFIDQKPSVKNLDGISIKDNLIHQTNLPKRDVFFSFSNKSFIRSGYWKLISKERKNNQKLELYNLTDDLVERNNLSKTNPDLVKTLSEKLKLWQKEITKGVIKISK
jgi:arylsulfatase A-like enzyme